MKEYQQPSWVRNELKSTASYAKSSQDMEVISTWLVSKLAEILDREPHEIDVQTDFTDYGLSSLEAVNLSGDLENFLECRLSPTLLLDYANIETLAEYLAKNAAKAKNGVFQENAREVYGVNLEERRATLEQMLVPQKTGEIPPEYYRFDLSPEYRKLKEQQQEIESLGIRNPFFTPQSGIVNEKTIVDNRELINFGTYNYLGMSGDREVSLAAKEAIDRYGTSVSASRLLSGEKPLHRQLELSIANFIGVEDSIVYVGGHATNVTTISHLFGQNDLIVYDALSHNSIVQGCLISGASLIAFPHNDTEALEQILCDRRSHYQRVLIVIEGVYSADGDIPNLPKFVEVKQRHKAFLMVDEAHSIGVLGKNGRGIGEYFGINPENVDLWMGTLSKSFASCGGYIAGCQALVEYLKYTAPGFVYSVGISPTNAAAALASLRVLKAEPERVARLHQRAKLFLELAQKRGLNTGMSKDSSIVPLIVGDSLKSVQLSHNLFHCGINVPFMFYPSVPQNAARLRFFITCTHTEEQIRFTVDTVARELSKI